MPGYRKLFYFFLVFAFLFALNSAHSKDKKKEKEISGPESVTYLILSGQYQKALDLLGSPKKTKGDWKNRLLFMQAYLTYQKGDYKKSAELFAELGEDYGILQDYVDYYHALALRESGRADEAVALLTKLKNQNISPTLAKKLDRDLALSYCTAGERGKAIDLLNAMIQTETSNITAYHLQYDRSKCLIRLGAPNEAVATLRVLYLNYPEGDLGEAIRRTLEEIGQDTVLTTADLTERGEQLMRNSRPALAASDFEAALAQYGGHASASLKLKLANAYFESRQYSQAAAAFEEVRRQDPALCDQKVQLRIAQSYARSDQFDKALREYQNLAAASEPSEQAKWDFKIAFLQMDKGDYPEANRRFEKLLEDYPQISNREEIYWYLAWNNHLLKNYAQALTYLDLLQEKYPRSRYAQRVPYWRARILEKQGNPKEARANFEVIARQDPFSYYGFLSMKRLDGKWEAGEPPKSSTLPHRPIPRPFYLSPPDSKAKKQVARVKELLWLGMWEDFLGELGQLTRTEEVPYDLQNLQSPLQNTQGNTVSDEGLENGYPPAYPTLVSLFSKTRDFPMALTWAVMREESRFRPDALSPAQAIGLMQIIPPTGAEIARDLGRQGFVPEQLYQPVTNIEFGVQYLSKNRARFGGDLPETIASYNAGPDAVERWVRARPGREWDEFVEEIPYSETNLYVKKVLKSYYIYKLMYERE